jgi:hypothetical protein
LQICSRRLFGCFGSFDLELKKWQKRNLSGPSRT